MIDDESWDNDIDFWDNAEISETVTETAKHTLGFEMERAARWVRVTGRQDGLLNVTFGSIRHGCTQVLTVESAIASIIRYRDTASI